MSSHTYHESIRDEGLADDCPACATHAKEPWQTLDDANFTALWELMLRVEYGVGTADDRHYDRYRSDAEAEAGCRLRDAARVLARLGLDPRSVP